MSTKVLKLLFIVIIISNCAYAQYKIVSLESDDIFIRYYYKTDTSSEIKNDSTIFLCLRKNRDTICIQKFVDTIKIWSNLYVIKKGTKKLPIKQRKGKRITLIYEPFYIAKLIRPMITVEH